MQELLKTNSIAVTAAAVSASAVCFAVFIRKARDSAAAYVKSVSAKIHTKEISEAVTAAVAATNQTYVDELKNTWSFNEEAQKEAMKKAMVACLSSTSAETQKFIRESYDDTQKYLTIRIEAEVRKQKDGATLGLPIRGELLETLEAPADNTKD